MRARGRDTKIVSVRVLVIEDNADNRQLIGYLLQAAGHHVDMAESGERGIELARTADCDVILIDLHMPGIDGFTTAERLRADPNLAGRPLVAVTALAMVGDREAILQRGFDGYVSKPIDPQLFAAQIETYAKVPSADGRDC
jgi:CheY-like chemotaxis protein